jgi:mRNA interferase RelE/StbE
MPDYTITFARSARRELEALDPPIARRVLAVERLAMNPRPPGCLKLTGSVSDWRVRVGDAKKHVDVAAVRHRSDAYR